MISYELAKQLKNNGFDQKEIMPKNTIGYPALIVTEEQAKNPRMGFYVSRDNEKVLIPTLSELIEACADDFLFLEAPKEEFKEEASWIALGVDDGAGSGNTPEIAVANLWLELNKKS